MSESVVKRIVVIACLCGALSACGQKGPLYLPDQAKDVVTRPTQTPPPEAVPEGPNTPQTADSPATPANPAPEVTPPPSDEDKDKKPDGTKPPR